MRALSWAGSRGSLLVTLGWTSGQPSAWSRAAATDGTFRWTTPAGRQYTTEPTRYPV